MVPTPATGWTREDVQDHFNARYVAVAGFTLMIWTHLTTLDEEKKYIWGRDVGVTLNKALFVAVRYISLVTFGLHCLTLFLAKPSSVVNEFLYRFFGISVAPLRCQGIIIALGLVALALIGACDVLFLLRTWAIYNRTRVSLICLVILLVVTQIPTLVVGIVWMITTLHFGPSKLYPAIPGCVLESTAPTEFWKIVIPSIIYNTVLSCASTYRVWSYRHRALATPLISLLLRDGIVYYVIILTYMFNALFMFNPRLIVVTVEGRFITSVVAVTCAQMQLNLRTAVYQVPGYVTSYYQNQAESQAVVGTPNDRPDPPRRPGLETLIFGGTATELERKYRNPSIESEIGEESRQYSHAIELVTTTVHIPQGKKLKLLTASADFGTGKRLPLSPQLRRASSFQDPSSLSLQHNVDVTAIPNANATDGDRCLSPTDNAHSGSPGRSVARANVPSARTIRAVLGFDSKHDWALAMPSSSSSSALLSSKPMKPIPNPFEEGFPVDDTSKIPSPRDLEPPRQTHSSRGAAPDSNLLVEVQVECEHDESGASLLPQSSTREDATRSGSWDGGIVETRVGVWR